MWRNFIPKEAPLEDKIPFNFLAEKYEMSGGHIKNAVVRAAIFAAHENTSITLFPEIEILICEELAELYLVEGEVKNARKSLKSALFFTKESIKVKIILKELRKN